MWWDFFGTDLPLGGRGDFWPQHLKYVDRTSISVGRAYARLVWAKLLESIKVLDDVWLKSVETSIVYTWWIVCLLSAYYWRNYDLGASHRESGVRGA